MPARHRLRTLAATLAVALSLLAGGPALAGSTPVATPGSTPAATPIAGTPAATPVAGPADLGALKAYMVGNADLMRAGTSELLASAQRYYDLAAAAGFDYQALWDAQGPAVMAELQAARVTWAEEAHGHYELNEGLVAGIPSLAYYDVLIDAGPSGEEAPAEALDVAVPLPDGRELDRPGNLFHALTEPTLWGTLDQYTALRLDMDGDGTIELGEALPDANVLLGGTQALDTATADLVTAIAGWQPTLDDTFTALVVMIPTMQGYFNDWKLSPSIMGAASEEASFVAGSRLVDVLGILGGLDVAWDIVQPEVAAADPAMATQIRASLDDMIGFVEQIHAQEGAGTVFTPEQADLFGTQLQAQADDVAGQITQAAALVGATIQSV